MFKTNEQAVVKAEELERKKQEKEMQKEYQAHVQQDQKIQEDYQASDNNFPIENDFPEKETQKQQVEVQEKVENKVSNDIQTDLIQDIQSEQLAKEKKEFEKEREQAIEKILKDDEINTAIEEEGEESLEEQEQIEIDNALDENQEEKIENSKEIENITQLGKDVEKAKFDLHGTHNEFDQKQEENFAPEIVVDDRNNVSTKEDIIAEQINLEEEQEKVSQDTTEKEHILGSEEMKEENNEEESASTSVLNKDNFTKEQKDTIDPKLLEQAQLAEELKNSYERDKQIIEEKENSSQQSQQEFPAVSAKEQYEKEKKSADFAEDITTPNSEVEWLAKNNQSLNVDTIVSEQLNEDVGKVGDTETLIPPQTWLLWAFWMQVDLPPEETKEEEYQTTSVFDDAQWEGKQIVSAKERQISQEWKEEERMQMEAIQRMQQPQHTQQAQQQKETFNPEITATEGLAWTGVPPSVNATKKQVDTSIEVIQKMMANISYNVVASALTISTVVSWLMLMVWVGMWVVDMFYGFSVQGYYSFIFYSLIIGAWVWVVRWSLADHE